MKATAWVGTEHHLEEKQCKTPSEVKKFLKGRLDKHLKWATAHNQELAVEMSSVREQIDSVDVNKVRTGEERGWRVTDDLSGVTFVYRLKKDAP